MVSLPMKIFDWIEYESYQVSDLYFTNQFYQISGCQVINELNHFELINCNIYLKWNQLIVDIVEVSATKMANICIKSFYLVLLFVVCIKFNHVASQTENPNFNFVDLAQIKDQIVQLISNNLFNTTEFLDGFTLDEITEILKCFKELNVVREALVKRELWAMKSK